MQATVKVMFPDGLREVPAFYQCIDLNDRFALGGLTPYDMDGWQFHGIIGGRDYNWTASQVSIRPSYDEPPSFWDDHSQFN